MSYRKHRVWLGATRATLVLLASLALVFASATESGAYMPPPIKAPNILPDEYPGEEQYLAENGDPQIELSTAERQTSFERPAVDESPARLTFSEVLRSMLRWVGIR